jgi:processive 1,2-diacylglycerol beta-glucosyltransferase
MLVNTVLILTSGFGEGHNAAARNIEAAIKKFHPELRVSRHDIFQETYPWLYPLAQWAYKTAIRRAPVLWHLVYKLLDLFPGPAAFALSLHHRAVLQLRRTALRVDASVVVSTFPGYGPIVAKTLRDHPVPFATVVTDSITINAIWISPACDFYLVPNEPTAQVIERHGVPRGKIRVTGFPVPDLFASPPAQPREAPPADGLWKVLYMVNAEGSAALDLVRTLLALENISLSVTCGRDTALSEKMKSLAADLDKPLEVFGWTPEMPELIRRSHVLVGKAGGATVQEAMAAKTPMIITKVVPGQEEGNARLVVERGAGTVAPTPEAVVQAVRELFANGGALYRERHKATSRLSHPAASKEISNFLSSACLKS